MLNKSVLQRVAQQAVKLTGNISNTITYFTVGQPVYDADTGVTTANETSTTAKSLMVSYKRTELEEGINKTDKKLIIACKDISVIPCIGDKIKQADGTYWVVMDKQQDFSECFWFLQVRPK